MAGSYKHIQDEDTGLFRFDLIENLRDAYEACEECFFLIEALSQGDQGRVSAALKEYYTAARGEPVSQETAARYAMLRYGRMIPFPSFHP